MLHIIEPLPAVLLELEVVIFITISHASSARCYLISCGRKHARLTENRISHSNTCGEQREVPAG